VGRQQEATCTRGLSQEGDLVIKKGGALERANKDMKRGSERLIRKRMKECDPHFMDRTRPEGRKLDAENDSPIAKTGKDGEESCAPGSGANPRKNFNQVKDNGRVSRSTHNEIGGGVKSVLRGSEVNVGGWLKVRLGTGSKRRTNSRSTQKRASMGRSRGKQDAAEARLLRLNKK